MARQSARGGGMVTGQIDTCIRDPSNLPKVNFFSNYFKLVPMGLPYDHDVSTKKFTDYI